MSRSDESPPGNGSAVPGQRNGASAKGGELLTPAPSHELGNAQAEIMTADQAGVSMNELVLYDQMRLSVDRCAAIDEAAGIKDKAQKLQYYAKIRDDKATETRFAEIKLRAVIKIGELSREKVKGERTELLATDGQKLTKERALKEAGIPVCTAHRYEELAGPREEQAEAAVAYATDLAFAKARETETPLTMKQLRSDLKTALPQTLGEPPKRPKATAHVTPEKVIALSSRLDDLTAKFSEKYSDRTDRTYEITLENWKFTVEWAPA